MHFSPRKVPGPVSTVVLALGFCLCCFHSARSQAVPEGLVEGIRIEPVARAEGTPVRLAHDPSSDFLYYLTFQGDVYRLAPPYAEQVPEHAYSTNDHGLSTRSLGLAIDHSGTMFLVGNKVDGPLTKGVVMRGVRSGDGPRVWSRVAETEPYPRSNTAFDHNFNAVAVSPDGQYLYINSGSRTDHGEEQSAGGQFPGMREVPLTAAIFCLPADANEIMLLNDDEFLVEGGYIYARGLRNSFSLAFNADGQLFATENSGDRDDCDELNWFGRGGTTDFRGGWA